MRDQYNVPDFFGDVTTTLIRRQLYWKAIHQMERVSSEGIQAFIRGYESAKQERLDKTPRVLRWITKGLDKFCEWADPDPTLWACREVLRVRDFYSHFK